ncbi:SH3 domain-containing protein 19 isoform X2 [Cetorhinus maximus]
MMMAEAWFEEEEEEVRGAIDRDPGSRHNPPAAGRLSVVSAGRSDRNKPDQSSRNSSHGPLSTIRAAIKRTSIRTSSQSEPRRERRRPDITVIAAEPIGPSPWYPGSPGNCATSAGLGLSYPRTLWRIDEPVAAEPPPSYEQVIREINQQPVPIQPPSRRSTTTTSTQTEFDQDTENIETRSADADFTSLRGNTPVTVQRPVKPSRPAVCLIPIRPVESEEPLISIESNSSREQSVQTNTNVVERPLPRPRSLGNFKILFEELQSETSEGEGEESGVLRGLTLCQNPLTEDNFANQETMGDNSGHSFLARIKAFETQTDSENSAGNTRPSKRPEVAPRSFGPKPAVVHGKPTVAPKPSVADKNSGGSDKVAETKPVAAERQGPIPLPKPQKMPAAARPKPEPPKKPKPSISAESKQSNGSNSTLDAGEKALSATVTPRESPTDRRNQVPVPAPRPTVAKRTISENRDPSSTALKPPASRPSVLPITKTSMMQVEESSSNKYAASPDKISNLQDLISFDDDDVVPAIPTGDNVTSLVTVDPFQTLPRGQTAPTDSTSSRPPLLRKPTVIRIPNKRASSEDIESPPPLPVETPVGNFVAQRPNIVPKTAAEDLCDVPRPVASQPLTVPGKVPPARPPPAKGGPARPPPPKISASATQLRHSSSELGINNTAGKSSPRAQSKNRPKSQVFQKKRPELPPRPAPGHPLYNKYMLPVPHGIAKCDVNSRVPGELSFQRGEVLILQQQIDQSLQCQKGFDTGKVPSSHLKIITPLDEEVVKGTNKKPFTSEQLGENSAAHAIVLHDFTADQNDELNLKSGDTVYLLEKLDKDWFSGKCKGHTGIFPANFVKVIVDLPIDNSQESSVKKVAFKSASLASGPRCVARFDFEGDQADELTFYEGDVIALKEYVSEEWARGQLKGRSGIFPLNFVEVVEDLPASEQQQIQNSPLSPGSDILAGGKAGETTSCSQVGNSNSQWCEALYDFKAEAADDLPFKRGDRILITEQLDSEWCKGKLNGREGTFPTVFVQMCSGEASAAKQQPSENKRGKAKALYDFVGENKDELDLKMLTG